MTVGDQPATGRLDGRVAVVSGASSGNGRAIALRLAAEGASVLCGDLQRAPVSGGLDGDEPTDLLITAAGGNAAFAEWNIADSQATARAIDDARGRYGRIDIVIANAGIALPGGSLLVEDENTWQRHLNVNLTGTWNTVRFGLRALIEQDDGGRIITLSSVAGLVGIAGVASGYSATKAAITLLTKQAAVDGAPYGITANAVCPGYVRTALNREGWADPDYHANAAAMHLLGRWGEPADVAAAVAFLASPDAAWITGIALPVDGGLTCV